MASKEVRKRFRHRTTTDAERKLTRARWNKLNPRIRIGHIQMKRWLYIKEKCCISSHDKVAELLINTWICYTGEVINEDSGTQSKPAKLAKTHKKTKRNVSSDHSTQAKLNEIPSQSTPAASGSILPEIESNNGISEISRDQRKDNSSPNPTISLPVTSSGDFAELKESSPPLPEPVIETDYAEDDAYNVSPYKETTESNNEEQDNSGITLQLEVESGDATEEQVSVKEEPVWDEGYTTTVSQSENSNSCHDRNMSVGQSWQLSNSTNEESTITTEIKKENESDEPQQERVVPVPIIPPTQQTTLPVLVTWPVPTNLVKNKVQLGPDGSAQNALLQKLKAVVQQNQQKATGQVPTVTQRTNQILVPIQSLSGTTIQLPISVHTPPTSQQLYSVQQTRPIVHLQPSTIVQQTRPIVQLQPSTIVQQTRPIVQLQPSAILSFQQPAPQRSTETTQVLASTSTSATAQASGSLSTNEQFLNPQLIKTEPTLDQSAGSGELPVVPSTSTQQEEVDTGQSDSNDISEDEPKKKRFKSVQINTDEEGTSLGKSTIKNTRWGVKILQVPCEVNSSDDELLSTDNSDELDNAQTSSIGCESQKLDERLRQPASEKPTPEVPGTAVSTSEPVQKRFKTVSKEEMERLFVARQAPTTKKNTIWGMKIFQDWNKEKTNSTLNMNEISAEELNETLAQFYCEVKPNPSSSRSEDLEIYRRNTIINIRAAINRHLTDIHRNIDIVRDKEFKKSNGVLDGMLKERIRTGLSEPTNHRKILEQSDLKKISAYLAKAASSPVILRQCVMYNLSIHFMSRGLDFHHQLKLDSFEFHSDDSGEYVTVKNEKQQRNYRRGDMSEKRMYATSSENCPVRMLRLFIEKTDKSATCLFNQYYRDALASPRCYDVWFSTKPLAKRSFFTFLKDICTASGVENKYTPNCLRATALHHLNRGIKLDT